MPLASTKLAGDLQYWYDKFIKGSVLNKYQIPNPASIPEDYIPDNSFIRLLFDDNWESLFTTYRYMYRDKPRTCWPSVARTRLLIYPISGKYYACDFDSTSICNINLFNLEADDLTMLDALLEYRLDSTSSIFISVDYSNLNTNLSKLIYIYLDAKINNNTTLYDNTTLISSPTNILENCYESYVVETLFNVTSQKDKDG